MVVSVLEYLINTSKSKERRTGFAKLHKAWRGFRNNLAKQHAQNRRARDIDTDRADGMLIPTWPEFVMIGGHLLAKASRRPDGTPPDSINVQEACIIALFVFLPAMRSAVWRTLQYHQAAAKSEQHRKYLDTKGINYMYYNDDTETFTVRLNTNIKRKHAVVVSVRRSEVSRVHGILKYYMFHHRLPLLRRSANKLAGRDFVFFSPTTGQPFDNASKMAKWVSSIVRGAAAELGILQQDGKNSSKLKCTPHVFRHALYEHIHAGNVPAHVRESVAAACLHSLETADKLYGRISQDRQATVAREYVYETAMQLLDKSVLGPSKIGSQQRPRYARPCQQREKHKAQHSLRSRRLLLCPQPERPQVYFKERAVHESLYMCRAADQV